MSQGETLIALLLGLIAYFLYQIAVQLSHLTGKRIKFRLPRLDVSSFKRASPQKKEEPKLPN